MTEKSKKLMMKEKKTNIIGMALYFLFLFIVGINLYSNLINEDTCGFKSKILFVTLFTLVSIIVGVLIIYIHKNESIKPEKFFLVASISLGIIYMFATPLFKGHDEQYHWYKSYAISLGQFRATPNEDGVLGDYLPRMVNEVFETQGFFTQINYKTSIAAWKYSINDTEENNNQFTYNAPTAVYSPVQMLPQAVGILISRAIGLDTYSQGMFGRFGNLCFYIIMGYLAIKCIPTKKYFLTAFLLSPKIMYLSSTMSGDIFTNSIIIFFISYVLKLRYDKKIIAKRSLILLLTLAFCVAICKTIYLPICFLVLILPRECFKNKQTKIIFIGITIILSLVTSLGWIRLSNSISFESDLDTLPSQQIKYIKEHPISFVGVLIRGVCDNFIFWTEDIVGGYMEWGSAFTQPEIISVIMYILFALAILNEELDEKNSKLKVWEQVLMAIMILVVIAGALTAMYINWTPLHDRVGGLDIIGVQGRYFVPIVILVALIIPTKYLKTQNKLKMKWVYTFILLCELYSIVNIFVRNI